MEAVALTNHGDVGDNRRLQGALAAEGVLLVHGVEISTLFGDFVIFSPDLDYLEGFRDVQDALRPGDVPDDAAVVWVHPGAGGGRSGSAYYSGLERQVAETIDAVEVYNGSWLGARYVEVAERIAAQLGVARTAGSDAHELEDLMRCYTELPDPVSSTADVVAALKGRSTIPRRPRAPAQAPLRHLQGRPAVTTLDVRTTTRVQFVDITGEVRREVRAAGVGDGVCVVFVPHTTAGVTINENADPTVRADLEMALERLVPADLPFRHLEGNSDAHAKASLVGSSVTIPVQGGDLRAGHVAGRVLRRVRRPAPPPRGGDDARRPLRRDEARARPLSGPARAPGGASADPC